MLNDYQIPTLVLWSAVLLTLLSLSLRCVPSFFQCFHGIALSAIAVVVENFRTEHYSSSHTRASCGSKATSTFLLGIPQLYRPLYWSCWELHHTGSLRPDDYPPPGLFSAFWIVSRMGLHFRYDLAFVGI